MIYVKDGGGRRAEGGRRKVEGGRWRAEGGRRKVEKKKSGNLSTEIPTGEVPSRFELL